MTTQHTTPAPSTMSLSIFDFQEQPVRVHLREDQPWFVAADVCRVLEISNSRAAVAELDDDERSNVGSNDTLVGIPDIRIPNRGLQVISESGLYSLIFRSRKPAARAFRRWVFTEVLPALRKQGQYSLTDSGSWSTRLAATADGVLAGTISVSKSQEIRQLCKEERKACMPPKKWPRGQHLLNTPEDTLTTAIERLMVLIWQACTAKGQEFQTVEFRTHELISIIDEHRVLPLPPGTPPSRGSRLGKLLQKYVGHEIQHNGQTLSLRCIPSKNGSRYTLFNN